MTDLNRPILVADIGGTNTRVALAQGRRLVTETIEKFHNADHKGLEPILRGYLDDRGTRDCAGACVAVAGPVHGGRARLTNLDWSMSEESIARATGVRRVALLNDLQAQGHAVGHVAAEDLLHLSETNTPAPDATALVVGVGTGFNAAPIYATRGGRFVPPSEAGHVNLPARGDDMRRLVRFIEDRHGFCSVEDVLSGRGLKNTYAWAAHEAGSGVALEAAAVVEGRRDGNDPVAFEAVRLFVQAFGLVAGNLALQNLPHGGVYLIGGVTRAIAPWFAEYGFSDAFRDKGRFSDFMDSFAVTIVTDDYAALTGCASHLTEAMASG